MRPKPLPEQDIQEIFRRVGPLWEDLRHAELLLTGCTGFFGAWLLESLLHAHEQLDLRVKIQLATRSIARFQQRLPHLADHPSITLLEGDIRHLKLDHAFTHIIHGAASFGADWQSYAPEEIIQIIIDGSQGVLRLAEQSKVHRFLHLSSGAVYGPQPAHLEKLPESHMGAPDPLSPHAGYGLGKRVAEHLCALSHSRCGTPCVSARCFAFLAPHLPLDAHFAAGNFIRDALRGQPIRITGDGSPIRSYFYGTDLAVWLWTLLIAGVPGKAYNVGSEIPVSIDELARQIADQAHVGVIRAAPSSAAPPSRYVPCAALARNTLGLRQEIDLAEAIARTMTWLAPEPA